MTLPDAKSLKGMTPMAAIIVIAIGGVAFIARDVSGQNTEVLAKVNAHIAATDQMVAKQEQQIQYLKELRDIAREACVNNAKNDTQVHRCLFPESPR